MLGNGSVCAYTLGVREDDEVACMRMHIMQVVEVGW